MAKDCLHRGASRLDRSGNLVGQGHSATGAAGLRKFEKQPVEAAGGDFNSVIKLNYYCAESVDPTADPTDTGSRDKYVNTGSPHEHIRGSQRLVRPDT